MKKKMGYISVFMILSAALNGQYIGEIIEYRPAPGQFINLPTTGTAEASESIKGSDRGMVSLGSAGGYIIFRFDHPLVNHPDHPYGVDFTLFGNPLPEWSEPGFVYVMKDENQNNLPDDKWYVLAGSDYFFSGTDKEHTIQYYKPEDKMSDISWDNSTGVSGSIVHNSFHQQSYYPGAEFDEEFYHENCFFSLLKISGNLDPYAPGAIKSYTRAFGLADNRPSLDWNAELPDNPYTWEQEGYGGDPFDLSWAVNEKGEYVEIDTAHFIKVQTSMYGMSQTVGEISTEITAGRLSKPKAGFSGETRMLVLEDITAFARPGEHQLRAYYFENGKYIPTTEFDWEVLEGDALVSTSGIIQLSPGMEITLKASLKSGEISSQNLTVRIMETTSVLSGPFNKSEEVSIWPNPASSFLNLKLSEGKKIPMKFEIRDLEGRLLIGEQIYEEQIQADLSGLNPGVYLLILSGQGHKEVRKFIKR